MGTGQELCQCTNVIQGLLVLRAVSFFVDGQRPPIIPLGARFVTLRTQAIGQDRGRLRDAWMVTAQPRGARLGR